jgi:(p)ppGpp synthase/HD superfamily hydrolase
MFEALKIDFFKDRIFVLTPKGDVIDLPEGATALDFAYSIHSEIGDRASGAKANGRLIPFSRELRSGEIIEIMTQKNKKPSPEWLHFVKTGLAKNKIRQALRISPGDSFLSSKERPIEIKIYGKNRVGFIKDISNIFAKLHTSIQTLTANRAGNEEAPVSVTFIPKHKNDLVKIEERLKKIPGVREVVSRFKS